MKTKSPFVKYLREKHIPEKDIPKYLYQISMIANLKLEEEIRNIITESELDEFRKIKGKKKKSDFLEKIYKEVAGHTLDEKMNEILDDLEKNIEDIVDELHEHFPLEK